MPDRSLRHILADRHQALRRAVLARHILRAAAACALLIVLAVLIGAVAAPGVGGAWLRLLALAAAAGAVLTWAARAALRHLPTFVHYLERIEEHFPDVRSWLRNALDLESHPPRDTSAELAQALQAETVRRMEAVPVASLAPRRNPAPRVGSRDAVPTEPASALAALPNRVK